MTIQKFIKRQFHTISAYSGTYTIRQHLLQHKALVVQDEKNLPIGVLTTADILKKPKNLVIDCLSSKLKLHPSCTVEKALKAMQTEQTDVLPVYSKDQLEGLVFEGELVEFLTLEKNSLQRKISERMEEIKNLHTNLKASKEILKAFFDSTQAKIFMISPAYKVMFFNRKASDIMELFYNKRMKTGQDFSKYISGQKNSLFEAFEKHFNKALRDGQLIIEKEIRYPDGRSIWISLEYLPVYEERTILGVAITITNITDRKMHEFHIQKQNDILTNIAWVQSHQTRKPVASILGLLNIIDKSELTKKNLEVLEHLEKSVQQLDKIIRDMVIKTNSVIS